MARAADAPNLDGTSTAYYLTNQFYPLMERLTSYAGPFGACNEAQCVVRSLGEPGDGDVELNRKAKPKQDKTKKGKAKMGQAKKGGAKKGGAKKGKAKETKVKQSKGGNTRSREGIAKELRRSVFGQDEAVDAVARRLALTSAGLELHPERPDGGFLFVGPSGSGKTELAYAIAESRFGSRSAMIRIDMSEYTHPADVSRLTGSAPGYHGNDQPQGWLTTRVIRQPRVVLLLDEIEKAHRAVYPMLLLSLIHI